MSSPGKHGIEQSLQRHLIGSNGVFGGHKIGVKEQISQIGPVQMLLGHEQPQIPPIVVITPPLRHCGHCVQLQPSDDFTELIGQLNKDRSHTSH
jgi:hypothetical protein